MSAAGIVLVALAIAVGIIGIVVPLSPGTLLVFVAIVAWTVVREQHHRVGDSRRGWPLLLGVATLIKDTWPVKRMRAADVRTLSLVAGAVVGIIGFFVIPVIGLVIGFVLGVYVAELATAETSGWHGLRRSTP